MFGATGTSRAVVDVIVPTALEEGQTTPKLTYPEAPGVGDIRVGMWRDGNADGTTVCRSRNG